jgi:uncharacterized protein YceH (UPF0502 family)
MSISPLTALETRILGCLLEKERVTPENYPLSLNSLMAGCNQTTNREPVTAYDAKALEKGLESLRARRMVTAVTGAGSRVQKYRHNFLDHYELDRREVALMTVLLLRGPQTPGELRSRSERLYTFGSLEEVESCLQGLCSGEDPLVRLLPARPGQKERRYAQLLSGEPEWTESGEGIAGAALVYEEVPLPESVSRIEALEKEIAQLKSDLQTLRDEFILFRSQF